LKIYTDHKIGIYFAFLLILFYFRHCNWIKTDRYQGCYRTSRKVGKSTLVAVNQFDICIRRTRLDTIRHCNNRWILMLSRQIFAGCLH